MESFEKNYIELEKKKYPRVEKLSQNVFGYIDILNINQLEVYIMFTCNEFGLPIGKIINTYFDYADIPILSSKLWLLEYKKDLLNRITEDLECKKEKIH